MKKSLILTILFLFAFSISHAQTFTFNNNLTVGASGLDVTNLQTFLISKGFDIPSVSSGAVPKGYFGSQTQRAVAAYQQSLGLPSFGYFGALTRARANAINSRINPIVVTSPNGGENWQTGTQKNITWKYSDSQKDTYGFVWLEYSVPACAEPGANPQCMVKMKAPVLIATVSLGSQSLLWNVGASLPDFTASTPNLGAPLPIQRPNEQIIEGQYKIKVCTVNQVCDSSDAYFNITSKTTGLNGPVINGMDSPTQLTVGQTGTWTIHASDPNNGSLSYSIIWGDESVGLPNANSGYTQSVPASQTNTFTHSYSAPGTYTVSVTIRNTSGAMVNTSSTVKVNSNSNTGPLNIISPNGGESLRSGVVMPITWTAPNYFRATNADIYLVTYREPCPANMGCTADMPPVYNIATVPINNNVYFWKVGDYINTTNSSTINLSLIRAGKYFIRICEAGGSTCDESDTQFGIDFVINMQN